MRSWRQGSASCPSASAGLTLSSLHAFPFVAAVCLHHTFCLSVHLPPPRVVAPSSCPHHHCSALALGRLLLAFPGSASGRNWQWPSVPMDKAVSWQLVGRWSQVTCGTPETGQCGEDRRCRGVSRSEDAPGWLGLWEWVEGPRGVGSSNSGPCDSSSFRPQCLAVRQGDMGPWAWALNTAVTEC